MQGIKRSCSVGGSLFYLRLRSATSRYSDTGRVSGRLRPKEVVASDRAESVQDLSTREETSGPFGVHRTGVDFIESNSTPRNLGLLIPRVTRPREGVRRECEDESVAGMPWELGERHSRLDPALEQERVSQPAWQVPV